MKVFCNGNRIETESICLFTFIIIIKSIHLYGTFKFNTYMKLFLKLFFLSIIIFTSCSRQRDVMSNEIFIPFKSDKEIKASSFIDDFKIIQLSTNDDNLIFQISKIQYLNEKIYIHDRPGNCIYIFNDDGTFSNKLNRQGAGPGEYIQITDFYVEEESLFVLDFTQQAILRYDTALEFIDKTNLKSFGSKFFSHNNSFLIYNEPSGKDPDSQFTLLSDKGDRLKEFLPRNSINHKYNWTGANVFAISSNKKYLSPRYSDTIFNISTDNNITPELIVDFEKHKFPAAENINSYDISDVDFPYLIKRNFYVSNKYLVFDYIWNTKRYFCIHDKENNTNNTGVVQNDLIHDFRFFPRWGNDNYLIEEIGSQILMEHFGSSPQFSEFTNVSEDDNPFIIIYKLKE